MSSQCVIFNRYFKEESNVLFHMQKLQLLPAECVCVAAYDGEMHFNFSNTVNRFILEFDRQSVYCELGFKF